MWCQQLFILIVGNTVTICITGNTMTVNRGAFGGVFLQVKLVRHSITITVNQQYFRHFHMLWSVQLGIHKVVGVDPPQWLHFFRFLSQVNVYMGRKIIEQVCFAGIQSIFITIKGVDKTVFHTNINFIIDFV